VRKIEFLKPLKVSMLSERRGPHAPFGLEGGQPAALGQNLIRRAGAEQDQDLGGKFAIDVNAGDILTIKTPGGGGFGQ
jgi:5-oxoprolinase (ATP-hydrolysing)